MNKKHIWLAVAVLVAVIGLVMPVDAQQYGTTANTSVTAASATATNNTVHTVTKYEDVSIQLSVLGIAASTNGDVTATFARSVDGTNYETTGTFDLVIAANGTTRATVITNINVGACGYLKQTLVANAAVNLTTNTITVGKKPQRYGR